MWCGKCSSKFNLGNRLPLNLPCCGETICNCCWLLMKNAFNQHICTFQNCYKRFYSEPLVCKAIEKMINQDQMTIYCDQHPQSKAKFQCNDHSEPALFCSDCLLKDHKGHSVIKFENKRLQKMTDQITEKLNTEYTEIGNKLSLIKSLKLKERLYTHSNFLTMIESLRKLKIFEEFDMDQFYEVQGDQEEDKTEQAQVMTMNPIRINSKLIDEKGMKFLSDCLNTQNFELQLIYRGSLHGYGANDFHKQCDNQGPTLTVIKSDYEQIFGGYTALPWASIPSIWIYDPRAFLFQLTKEIKLRQRDPKTEQQSNLSVFHCARVGPYFGAGADLSISDVCNERANSSKLGVTYLLPEGIVQGSPEAKSFLGGCPEFKVIEIEVFKVISD